MLVISAWLMLPDPSLSNILLRKSIYQLNKKSSFHLKICLSFSSLDPSLMMQMITRNS